MCQSKKHYKQRKQTLNFDFEKVALFYEDSSYKAV